MKALIKNEYLINTGAAFMGARDWDGETAINLQAYKLAFQYPFLLAVRLFFL